MKRRRTRCTIKWVGLVVCGFLIAAIFYSRYRGVIWDSPSTSYEVSLMQGAVNLGWRPAGWSIATEKYPSLPGWSSGSYGNGPPSVSQMTWWVHHNRNKSWEGITVPVWIPLLAVGLPTVWLWWADRRRPHLGKCRCGYDMTGNESRTCPECGQTTTAAN